MSQLNFLVNSGKNRISNSLLKKRQVFTANLGQFGTDGSIPRGLISLIGTDINQVSYNRYLPLSADSEIMLGQIADFSGGHSANKIQIYGANYATDRYSSIADQSFLFNKIGTTDSSISTNSLSFPPIIRIIPKSNLFVNFPYQGSSVQRNFIISPNQFWVNIYLSVGSSYPLIVRGIKYNKDRSSTAVVIGSLNYTPAYNAYWQITIPCSTTDYFDEIQFITYGVTNLAVRQIEIGGTIQSLEYNNT